MSRGPLLTVPNVNPFSSVGAGHRPTFVGSYHLCVSLPPEHRNADPGSRVGARVASRGPLLTAFDLNLFSSLGLTQIVPTPERLEMMAGPRQISDAPQRASTHRYDTPRQKSRGLGVNASILKTN